VNPDQLGLFPLSPAMISINSDPEPDDELWGYFFATQNGHRVKHGISRGLDVRQRNLQTGNPERLVLAGAYPTYSPLLESAVGAYFDRLRATGTREWFEPWTVEFKITALGGGLPPSVFEQWVTVRAERARRLTAPGASIQHNVTELQRSGALKEFREADGVIVAALQDLVERSPFEALQPLAVQVNQWWQRRLSGEVPFDLAKAELRPAFVDLSQMRLHER
jgi:hypothetical protein